MTDTLTESRDSLRISGRMTQDSLHWSDGSFFIPERLVPLVEVRLLCGATVALTPPGGAWIVRA